MYKIQVFGSMWIAPWEGDPPRTALEKSAKTYATLTEARAEIRKCAATHPLRKKVVYQIVKQGKTIEEHTAIFGKI